VLPLRNHTNHYYLYAPLAGTALGLAVAADEIRARLAARAATSAEWGMAAAIALLLAANGALLVRKIELYPFSIPTLRSDPTVDRALIAGHVVSDLKEANPPRGMRLLFWSPIAPQLAAAAGQDTTVETYTETNVRQALAEDLAIRLFFPNVERVEYTHNYRPLASGERYAIYRPDGRVRVVDDAGLEALLSTLPRYPR
jgi:hypothetical protein